MDSAITARLSKFIEVWTPSTPVLIVTALPGWDVQEFEAEVVRYLQRLPDREVVIVDSVEDLTAARENSRMESAVLVVPYKTETLSSGLWEEIVARTRLGEHWQTVVFCSDLPFWEPSFDLKSQVVSDSDLAYTSEELTTIAQHYLARAPMDGAEMMAHAFEGNPFLVKRHVERMQLHMKRGTWAPPLPNSDLALLEVMLGGVEAQPEGIMKRALLRASGMRKFSASMLKGSSSDVSVDEWLFDRLARMPFLHQAFDDETGCTVLIWSGSAWSWLDANTPSAIRQERLREGLRIVAASGAATSMLSSLLALGELNAADNLVRRHFRRFLLFTDPETLEMVESNIELLRGKRPFLELLVCTMRARTNRNDQLARVLAEDALEILRTKNPNSMLDRIVMSCHVVFAAAAAGQRSLTHRGVDELDQLLQEAPELFSMDGDTQQELAEQVYLGFWAALQSDRHEEALRFARLISRLGNPDDQVTQIDYVGLFSQEDFAGVERSTDLYRVPEGSPISHTAAFVYLGAGDREAARLETEPYLPLQLSVGSRSAFDALVILMTSLVSSSPST